MKFTIRPGLRQDAKAVHEMIVELAVFEKEPEAVSTTAEDLERDGFDENIFSLLIAEDEGGNTIGMALYFDMYSTWKGKMLYLDDLYVKEAYRGKGVGRGLIDELFRIAQREKHQIIKWNVLDWNTPALEFYKSLGAVLDTNWYGCKFYKNQIENFKFIDAGI